MGIIGALDPYTYKVFMGLVPSVTSNSMALSLPSAAASSDMRDDIVQWFHYERCTLAEFYPAFAIANLMQMLNNEALNHLHRDIIQALLTIFSSLGPKCSQYVDKVMPKLIDVTQNASRPDLRQYFLQQLASLISTIGDAWSEDAGMKLTVINVMQQVGAAFGASFAPYVAELCPYLLKVFYSDRTVDRSLTCAAFACVESISVCLAPYIHLVLPPILTILDDSNVKTDVRRAALDTVYQMGNMICLTDHAPQIMQVWLRTISVHVLQPKLLRLLVIIVRQMWKQFMVFRASVDSALARHSLQSDEYFKLMAQLDKGSAAAPPKPAAFGIAVSRPTIQAAFARLEKGQRINFDVLKKTWSVSQLVSKEAIQDWDQWLLLLRIQFIRQTPSAALRACAPLADMHQPLAKLVFVLPDLFNAAFMSVWTDLDEIQQKDLETNLKMALDSSRHTDIIQTILNLAEFMDHSEKGPLPVGNKVLSKSAEQTRAYAKALRYTELHIREKFARNPDAEHCTALITYANKLNVQEVAAGVVALAEKHNVQISMQGRWYEKLNEWEKALEMYETEKTINDEVCFVLSFVRKPAA
ncbi:unnamed protein product [Toxocara canis]|uniref:Serine/threonine-protein kinase TOR n=1 Tax=Toxocara canis TaxID=6265 RepID=A0A3P7GUW8_TOXCA|nr:unnamed protein product [Toxocara canis]